MYLVGEYMTLAANDADKIDLFQIHFFQAYFDGFNRIRRLDKVMLVFVVFD